MPFLFSYGTLQQTNVQLATFGRELTGVSDSLVGYEQSLVAIADPEVVRASGKTHHPIIKYGVRRSVRGLRIQAGDRSAFIRAHRVGLCRYQARPTGLSHCRRRVKKRSITGHAPAGGGAGLVDA